MSQCQAEEGRDVEMFVVMNNSSTTVHRLNDNAIFKRIDEATEFLFYYNQPLIDILSYVPYLTESKVESIKLFQSEFDEKIKVCFEAIDSQRKEKREN